MPLIRLLSPYSGIRLRNFDNQAAADLHKKLCAVALPKFARQLMTSFREPGFVERLVHKEENTFEARCIFWEATGPLWGPLRNEFLHVLAEAPSNRSIQSNAYEFLHWFVLSREGHVPGDPKAMQSLLSDQAVFDAIWNAAIATPLAPRAVYQLRHLPKILEQLKIKCEPPSWWQEIAASFIAPAPNNPPATGPTPTHSTPPTASPSATPGGRRGPVVGPPASNASSSTCFVVSARHLSTPTMASPSFSSSSAVASPPRPTSSAIATRRACASSMPKSCASGSPPARTACAVTYAPGPWPVLSPAPRARAATAAPPPGPTPKWTSTAPSAA